MKLDKFKPGTVYVTYIVATPEKVWKALTNGKLTAQYFFGRRVEIEPKIGGNFRFWQDNGTLDVEGKVVEFDSPRRLSVTWRVMWIPELKKLPDCLVTYQIDDLGKSVRLTMTESHQIKMSEKLLEGGRRGWPMILSSLKSLVETGKPLPPIDMGASTKVVEQMKRSAKKITK